MSQNPPNELDGKYRRFWYASLAFLLLALLVLAHEALSLLTQEVRLTGASVVIVLSLAVLFPVRRKGREHLSAAYHLGVLHGIRREQQLRNAAEEDTQK